MQSSQIYLMILAYIFLAQIILKKCDATLLRWYMWDQSTPILLYRMAFQWFWLDTGICNTPDNSRITAMGGCITRGITKRPNAFTTKVPLDENFRSQSQP